MIAMVACGQGLALMPELMFKEGAASAGCQVLQLEPAAKRTIGLACLSRGVLSPAARGVCEACKGVCKEKVSRAVGAGHARPAGLRHSPFTVDFVGRGKTQSFSPP